MFIVDDSLSVPLVDGTGGGSISDATFQFEEAARRLASGGRLNRVAVARTSTQLPRMVVGIDGTLASGAPAVPVGNVTAAVEAASAGLVGIRGSTRTEGTLGDTFSVVADDLVRNIGGRTSFTDASGTTHQSPLVIV